MKHIALTIMAAAMTLGVMAELVPDTLSVKWYRTNAVATASSASYYKGTTLRLTNCYAFVTGSTTQSLAGVTVTVKVGDSATNLQTTATVRSAPNGLFDADAKIPAVGGQTMRVQVKLTAGTVVYIYPDLPITMESPL